MSLLNDFSRQCVLLEKKRAMSPEGGWTTVWEDGESFYNYQALDTSMQARIAEKDGVSSLYSALVDSALPIEFNDYFRDVESGVTYRVTSNPSEKVAPKSSSFSLKYFTAERREPPQ